MLKATVRHPFPYPPYFCCSSSLHTPLYPPIFSSLFHGAARFDCDHTTRQNHRREQFSLKRSVDFHALFWLFQPTLSWTCTLIIPPFPRCCSRGTVFNEPRFTSSAESTTIMRAIGVFLCTRKDILVLARISYKVRARRREFMGEAVASLLGSKIWDEERTQELYCATSYDRFNYYFAFSSWRSYILGNFYFPSRKSVSGQCSRSVGNRRELFRNCQ